MGEMGSLGGCQFPCPPPAHPTPDGLQILLPAHMGQLWSVSCSFSMQRAMRVLTKCVSAKGQVCGPTGVQASSHVVLGHANVQAEGHASAFTNRQIYIKWVLGQMLVSRVL